MKINDKRPPTNPNVVRPNPEKPRNDPTNPNANKPPAYPDGTQDPAYNVNKTTEDKRSAEEIQRDDAAKRGK